MNLLLLSSCNLVTAATNLKIELAGGGQIQTSYRHPEITGLELTQVIMEIHILQLLGINLS